MLVCTHLYKLLIANTVQSDSEPDITFKITRHNQGKDFEGTCEITLGYKGLLIHADLHISVDLSRYKPNKPFIVDDIKHFDTMHAYRSNSGVYSDECRITAYPEQEQRHVTDGFWDKELGAGVYLGFNSPADYNLIDIDSTFLKGVIRDTVSIWDLKDFIVKELNEYAKKYIRHQAEVLSDMSTAIWVNEQD